MILHLFGLVGEHAITRTDIFPSPCDDKRIQKADFKEQPSTKSTYRYLRCL